MANEGIQVEIYDLSDVTKRKAILNIRQEPKALREVKGMGGASFKIPVNAVRLNNDPTILQSRNICKFRVDGDIFDAMLIGSKDATTIAEAESAEESYLVSGEGLRALLRDATVKPWGGMKDTSKDTRAFSFASPVGSWYNPADWSDPIKLVKQGSGSTNPGASNNPWRYYPENWPAQAYGAWWVWDSIGARTSATVGSVYYRLSLPDMDAGKYSFCVAVDDYCIIYVDGEEVARTDATISGYAKTKKVDFNLEAGDHIIGVYAYNRAGRAGFLGSLLGYTEAVNPIDKGTVTMTIANPGVFTKATHGLSNGDKIYFTTEGVLPNGVEAEKDYYVRSATTNTFQIGTGPLASGSIETQGTQLGPHRLFKAGVDSYPYLITYTGMTSDELDEVVANAEYTRNAALSAYTALPAGNEAGNNTERAQAAAKKQAYVSYQKAQQLVDQAQDELDAATAMEAQGITWEMNAYPVIVPGWTAGAIVRQLWQEAEDRGVRFPTYMTCNFTDTEDSYGNPWPDPLDWTFKVGQKYLSVVEQLEELGVDAWVNPDTYAFNMVAGDRGIDRSIKQYDVDNITVIGTPVVFKKGKNLRKATIKTKGQIVNSIDLKLESGWVQDPAQDSASITKYGVIEDSLAINTSENVANQLAAVIFTNRANEEEGASYDIYPTDKVPGKDFDEGDWIKAPNERGLLVKRRVMSIALEETDAGRPVYTIELDTIFRDNETKISKAIAKLGGSGVGASSSTGSSGSGVIEGGASGSSNIPTDTATIYQLPQRPTDVEVFSIGYWGEGGMSTKAKAVVTWAPVTQNTDLSPTIPQYYEVWAYPTSLGLIAAERYRRSALPGVEIEGFDGGTEWEFVVYAYNSENFRSEVSEPSDPHVMELPPFDLEEPTTPDISVDLTVVSVYWDSFLDESSPVAPPVSWLQTEVESSATELGTYTLDGVMLGGTWVGAGFPIGDRWIRLVARDKLGRLSAPSVAQMVTISSSILETIEEAQETADAALDAATGAQTTADGRNRIFWDTAEPTPTPAPVQGDMWYSLNDDDQVTGISQWNGTAWVDYRLIADSLIIPSSIGNVLIADGAITAPKITASEEMWARVLGAHQINVDEVNVGALTAAIIQAGTNDILTLTAAQAINLIVSNMAPLQTQANTSTSALATISQFFEFLSTGLKISANGSTFSVNIDNDSIDFLDGANRRAWLEAAGFFAERLSATYSITLGSTTAGMKIAYDATLGLTIQP